MATTLTVQDNPAPLYHPLDLLRGTIRRFVVVDALLTVGVLLIAAFWLGMAADYGLFQLTGFDWVQDAPWGLRLAVLITGIVLVVGVLVARMLLRLNREFSYPSLALVLEKRYPAVLGDRLITAVELADVKRMGEYGYSEEMIRRTIDEARERVDQVPVNDVFNWRRLWSRGILLGVLVVGLLLLVFTGYSATTRTIAPVTFAWKFGDVAMIWGERNLLLWNTPWPRSAHLELVDFPGDELRIGKDAAAPTVRVRAVEWVVADRATHDGWRPLKVGDLATLGVEAGSLPGDRLVDDVYPTTEAAPWSQALADAVDRPSMSRTVRKLEVPPDVTLSYRGEKTGGTVSLTRDQSGVYSGDVTGLKESVRFNVRGGDYSTTTRKITLLPPPALTEFRRTEYQPAYLYHPAPLVGPDASRLRPDWDALADLRQVFPDKPLSLTGDKSVFSVVSGTGVEINGRADKPLKAVTMTYKVGKGTAKVDPDPADTVVADVPPQPKRVPVPVNGDAFTLRFLGDERISRTVEFDLTLVDNDDVTSTRSVLIQTVDDQPPQVEVAVDVLRRKGNAYLCTPMALVPFVRESVIRDDRGLSSVAFEYTVIPVEADVVVQLQTKSAAGVWAFSPIFPNLGEVITPVISATSVGRLSSGGKKQFGSTPVDRFVTEYERLPKSTLDTLEQRLAGKIDPDFPDVVRQIKLDDLYTDAFDLERALPDLRAGQTDEIQPRYRIELNVVAADTNVVSGPKTGRNVEAIRLLIVSEQDLLAEITTDEETQIARMDTLITQLEAARTKLTQVAERMVSPTPPADIIVSSAVRALDAAQDLGKSRDQTSSVLTEYLRLRREAEFNRCNQSVVSKWDDYIIVPLESVLETEFPAAEQSLGAVQSELAAGLRPDETLVENAKTDLDELLAKLKKIRQESGDVVNINKLREDLRKIIEDQLAVAAALKRSQQVLIGELFNPALLPVPPVTLALGEKKTITQGIDWKVYVDGSIKVKIELPKDSGLQAPSVIDVLDDRDDFEYAITAGQKTGDFDVKLIPTVGQPVIVKVTVK